MRVLAFDTSSPVLTVAVADESRVLGEWTTNLNKNHSVTLMDGISALLDEIKTDPDQLTAIAVGQGPGSYTGVRIGVSTAKSMAWSLGIPVIGVSTLETIAMNAIGFGGLIVPLFDARRGQVYTGCWDSVEMTSLRSVLDERIILLRDWLPQVLEQAAGRPVLFLGDDVSLHRAVIEEMVGEQARFAPSGLNHPRAAQIAWLGMQKLEQADAPDTHAVNPEYLQVSEAEAKWLANQQK
ncbi:tRNA (adenosine(37)-N6)-threonylcarbamoyltransferase complex dimerization subunit type 1 TsaB [Brevibacillus dissolubilis]|uniref:tRNA (adenosine(37)-N6)-threonylcarbamoyltransferase complex dimerization subunit type 1 TsaB n=1 Tax=Brevibacillus dissolubilis TaxID=1844116 RepID=UPI0011171099|nr:tRNA (adenosine(37)-N6)-threonylcarbamoyltransferase complex dimerization subunit type 1 TsaB [Brevibacillus dissolubilis]